MAIADLFLEQDVGTRELNILQNLKCYLIAKHILLLDMKREQPITMYRTVQKNIRNMPRLGAFSLWEDPGIPRPIPVFL